MNMKLVAFAVTVAALVAEVVKLMGTPAVARQGSEFGGVGIFEL